MKNQWVLISFVVFENAERFETHFIQHQNYHLNGKEVIDTFGNFYLIRLITVCMRAIMACSIVISKAGSGESGELYRNK